MLGNKNVHKKYIQTSANLSYSPLVWKRAQAQGLKEYRPTITGDEDQGIVSSEEGLVSRDDMF